MNTPAHMIVGMAAFGKPDQPRVTLAAVAGGFAPDLLLFAMVGVSINLLGIPPGRVFGELFFSDQWQQVFAFDNSFILWGLGLAAAIWWRRVALIAFTGAALLHLVFDFFLHNDDARMQFWPLSRWIFNSPFSYWDPRYYAGVIGPMEIGLAMILCVYMWVRLRQWAMRGIIVALGVAEVSMSHIWHTLF